MAQSPSDWRGKTLANGRYLVRAKLGEGGMGYVFRAHDKNLDADVVIKAPRRAMLEDPEFASRFAREIRSLVKLAHPCVVKITDVGEHDGVPFAVMQYLSGGSLEDYRPSEAPAEKQKGQAAANVAELGDWLPGVADALDFVHSQGYVHRDVKPGNILFDAHGHVFLSDFGVAKALGTTAGGTPARGQTAHTGTGMVLGTPEYMAPELVMGRAFDGRIDQYALAVTVFEMLTGRRPFDASTPTAILVMQTTEEAPSLNFIDPRIPGPLSDAVARALAKNPAHRFPTCKAFAEAVVANASAAVGSAASSPSGNALRADQVRLACPSCHKNLILPARLFQDLEKVRGKKFTCPSCQSHLAVGDDGRSLVSAPAVTGAVTPPPGRSATVRSPGASAATATPPPATASRPVVATQIQEAPPPISRPRTMVERAPFVVDEGERDTAEPARRPTPVWVWAAAGSGVLVALAASVAAAVLLMPSLTPPKPPPKDGHARIDATGIPKDALITLDRVQRDPADLKNPLTLAAGDHELAVSSAGFLPYHKSFVVDAQKPAEIRIALTPLPAATPPKPKELAKQWGMPDPGDVPPPPPNAVMPPATKNATLAKRAPLPHRTMPTFEPVPDGPPGDAELAALLAEPEKFANRIVVAAGLFAIHEPAARHPDGTFSLDVDQCRFQFENLKRPQQLHFAGKPVAVVADTAIVRELNGLRRNGPPGRGDNAVVLTFHVQKRTDAAGESWVPVLKKVEIITMLYPVLIGEQKLRGAVHTTIVTPAGTRQGGGDRMDWGKHLGAKYIGDLKKVVHQLNKSKL